MPAMIFISVDLPAPFSPISAWTWPRFSRNATLSSASTPGNASRTTCAVVGLSMAGPIAKGTLGGGGAGQSPRRASIFARSGAPDRGTSVLLHEVGHVGRRHELERNVDFLLN